METVEKLREAPHFSYTSLNTYLNVCQLQYYYRYVEKLPAERTAVALPFGTAMHQALSVQVTQFKDLRERIVDARRARHDLRHHMAVLETIAEEGDADALREYIKEFRKDHRLASLKAMESSIFLELKTSLSLSSGECRASSMAFLTRSSPSP